MPLVSGSRLPSADHVLGEKSLVEVTPTRPTSGKRMKRKPPPPPSSHPHCRLCRDGTYAAVSLQIFPAEDCEWTHYCEPCGKAMASVVGDGQQREPSRARFPDPPPPRIAPEFDPLEGDRVPERVLPEPERGTGFGTPSPAPTKAPTVAPTLKSVLKSEGYDLLELMGWKK